jgi:lipoprotein-anchoring transpeptidase ErfK/SrfK
MSACGGDVHTQQQATKNKATLNASLNYAQKIGVPSSLLNPVQKQEQQLSNTNAPFNPFNDQPDTDYYHNLSLRYTQLNVQTQGIISSSTEQAQSLAQRSVQNFQTTLSQRRAQGLPVQPFSHQFAQNQQLLSTAKYPKDYAVVTKNAQTSIQALNLLQSVSAQLTTFQTTINQMQAAQIDVTAMTMQYQNDQQDLVAASTPADFKGISTYVNGQYQQAVANSIQALPFITKAKISLFETQVNQLKTFGIDNTQYQKRLDADKALMGKTQTIQAYEAFSKQIDNDMAAMHNDYVRGDASYLVKQFHKEATDWGQAHLYLDKSDGQKYPLDAGYLQPGIGEDLDNALSYAVTPDDYQTVVDQVNNVLFNLHTMEADYSDKTPYNQVHTADSQMLDHYKLQKGTVLMISQPESALRLYKDGKLIRSFVVTVGRVELPIVPGVWPTLNRLSPTTFKSPYPKGSPYYYDPTPIHYAINYHWGGYFVHDSWWRADYGTGTQFPHEDSTGNVSASNGSHGCINMQLDQAGWVYANTDYDTQIVIY